MLGWVKLRNDATGHTYFWLIHDTTPATQITLADEIERARIAGIFDGHDFADVVYGITRLISICKQCNRGTTWFDEIE